MKKSGSKLVIKLKKGLYMISQEQYFYTSQDTVYTIVTAWSLQPKESNN